LRADKPADISLKVRKMLERTPGLHKLMSKEHRMSMKLESKALGSLHIKAETLRGTKV